MGCLAAFDACSRTVCLQRRTDHRSCRTLRRGNVEADLLKTNPRPEFAHARVLMRALA
jgi:hypothetical protein